MPTGYQIKDQEKMHYVTLQVVEWIDIFTRQNYREIIIESFRFCIQSKHLVVYGYVIMSNHIHLLARSSSGDLSGTLRDFKSYTSKQILKVIEEGNESRKEWMMRLFKNAAMKHKRNSEYQLWTHENHAMEVFSYPFFEQKLNYIHNNPVKAGIVSNPEDYLYSSAQNYAGEKGLLEVEIIDRLWKTVS